VNFSYSADSGMLWQQITGTAQKLASDLKTYYNYSATQVQQALSSLQWNSDQVVAAINSVGYYGQQFVDAVTNLFHTNREFIWNGVLALDVSGASQTPGAPVIQYWWNGGNNQKWVEVPAGDGWIEIVNVNSGQCLTPSNYSTAAGAAMVQYPCYGVPTQKWYKYSSGQFLNQGSRLWLDVNGESVWPGATIDQWYWNGHKNQYFTESWAA
jgi:hypothetical protein